MGIGIHGRHGDQDVDRVVILMIENQRRFQRDQRKASFLDPLFRATVRHRQAGSYHKIRAVLSYAIQNGLVVARLYHIGFHQQINAQLDGFLPGAGISL